MNTYKLVVKSQDFKVNYNIKANNLKEASLKAKSKFANEYKVFNTTVGLCPTDLHNHIDEIFKNLVKGDS